MRQGEWSDLGPFDEIRRRDVGRRQLVVLGWVFGTKEEESQPIRRRFALPELQPQLHLRMGLFCFYTEAAALRRLGHI